MADERSSPTRSSRCSPRAARSRRPPRSPRRRSSPTPTSYAEADADFEAFWARQAGELLDWYEPWHTVLEWDLPFAEWFVGGKLNVAYNCLDRHVDGGPGRQGRVPLGGRARRHPHHHLRRAPRRRLPARQRAQGARRREGRPGQHLPRHGARAADGAARVRAHRRRALGGVRRLLVRLAARPHPGRRGQGAHHRRRRVAARQRRAAEGDRRRRGRRVPDDREGAGAAAHRAGRRDDRRSRRVVARPRARSSRPTARPSRWTRRTSSTSSTRAAPRRGPRASCTRPAATSRRSRGRTSTCSTCTPDTDVYWCAADVGWVTGHSYIVYGPLDERRDERDLRGHARPPGQGPALADRRDVRRHHPLHRAHRDPHVHEVGSRSTPSGRDLSIAATARQRR